MRAVGHWDLTRVLPGGRSQVIGGSAALANRIHVSAPGAPYVNIKPAMRKHPETAWKQMLMLRIYSTSQSNSGVRAQRPMRKQYTCHAETSRNSLATSAHVADLQHWPAATCGNTAPAMRKHPETAWKQVITLRIYSTGQSNSRVRAWRPIRKQPETGMETRTMLQMPCTGR